jgi:hypothetical protein
MNLNIKRSLLGLALLGGVAAGSTGCQSHAGNGALLGGAIGAGTGAIIGHNSHGRTAGGALIGGAVGALAGGIIGDAQDRDERGRGRSYDDGYRSPPPRYERTETRYYETAPPPPAYYETRTTRTYYGPRGGSYTEVRRYDY